MCIIAFIPSFGEHNTTIAQNYVMMTKIGMRYSNRNYNTFTHLPTWAPLRTGENRSWVAHQPTQGKRVR